MCLRKTCVLYSSKKYWVPLSDPPWSWFCHAKSATMRSTHTQCSASVAWKWCSQAERRSTSFVLLCNRKKGGLCTIVVTELSTLTSSSRLVTTTPSSGLFHQEPRHTPYSVSIQAIHILISHYSLHRVLQQEVAFIDRYTPTIKSTTHGTHG